MATSTNPIMESLINHIVLPPRLPGRDDRNEKLENGLIDHFITASKAMRDITNDKLSENWDWVRRSLETAKVLNARGKLTKATLLSEFRSLQQNVYLILNIAEQNAALLIHCIEERVVFECMETSASAEDVLDAENALEWDFPGYAVDVPLSTFRQPDFLEELAVFLEQASTESIKRFAARTFKAGSLIIEARDSASCALISQMLMTLLEGNGRRIYPSILKKRVRDDVVWFNAEKPWRRNPLYLVLRVALQRQLYSMSDFGRTQYKFMRCLAMAQVLELSIHGVNLELLAFLKAKLCRRLAKLENDGDKESSALGAIHEQTFITLRPIFQKAIRRASEHIELEWVTFKQSNQRPVMPLPRRAADRDLDLTLPNSGVYLQRIMAEALRVPPRTHSRLSVDVSAAASRKIGNFGNRYIELSDMESSIELKNRPPSASITENESRCREVSKQINAYLNASKGAYSANSEERSIMLLSIMELWMSLDKCACVVYPLLREFHPLFTSEMLDVLQLSLFKDMCRLQKVQEYLQGRCRTAVHEHPLPSDPTRVKALLKDYPGLSRYMRNGVHGISLGSTTKRFHKTHYRMVMFPVDIDDLATPNVANLASKLLHTARSITASWVKVLREEIRQAIDSDTASRCQTYCLWAALLCRRTFFHQNDALLDPEALRCFIECSITLQDNLSNDPALAPAGLKNAIIRDLKAVYHMRHLLRESLLASPQSLLLAVGIVWPLPEGSEPRVSSTLIFDCPEKWWVYAKIVSSALMKEQTLSFHLFYGYLLIDGQPLGMLPADYRASTILKDLFGDVNLLTFPSSLPGSKFQLTNDQFGHTIHLGSRDGNVVVRACLGNTILEFIPSRVFHTGSNYDLPIPLLFDCVHR
ncbi:hypothetical protein SS1G_06825 [Sclerotinia sclerotiorum 1980 UF-70]|uniref:DUF6606 domain-containing protein n=1 Tax=Sclerotinia sclerotiorum (strain ATCC 18683 / 1980 / Ss-1) TaxID=665079 RepID=A7ENC6_SCLS1|nr:hypothetical protein SS1G_06825 [Sclerotinia sclerotiorum 1980 UF-70]EDO04342.1 hypothetical protein SS1G_06825 [Sclerotinia sclerotiorum 1980 UF-70]